MSFRFGKKEEANNNVRLDYLKRMMLINNLTVDDVAKKMHVDRITVHKYLSEVYNINDSRWKRMQDVL